MCLCTKYTRTICYNLEQLYLPNADRVLETANELSRT